ncbi:MAG TPA: sugar-binding protein, partial [Ferruginibacter sp.]|nr:sugar-binding protein [Ferruginibacter sp.]
MKNYKLFCKVSLVLLSIILSFCSTKVCAQFTIGTCSGNNLCSSNLVGHVTFANTSGTTTGRWSVDNLAYGGLTNESFTIEDSNSYTYAAAGNLVSGALGGTYTIVNNPSSVNGPLGTPLYNSPATTPTGGVLLFRPNNGNTFARYTITGLTVGGWYCVRVKMRNAAVHADCNQGFANSITFQSLSHLNISGGGVSGGQYKQQSGYTPTCGSTDGGWDGNNQTYGIRYDQEESWYECTFQIGQNPNNTNDAGFSIAFNGNGYDANDVLGIEEIQVYGCVPQQITSSNGTSVCETTPTTLTAQGIGSTTDTYTWQQSTDGTTYTPVTSSTSYQLTTTPSVATYYKVTCVRTGLTIPAVLITPVNCCGPTGLFTIPKVCDGISVDGNDNEPVWYTAPWKSITNVASPLVGTNDCTGGCLSPVRNPAGQWRAVYTPTDIYFDVVVNGANPQNAGGVYYQDAVEIYIADSLNTPRQFGYTYNTAGNPVFYNSNGAVNGSAKIIKGATTWTLEVDIPVGPNKIKLSSGYINMEVAVNQANPTCPTCRSAQLFTWSNAVNAYTSTSNYHAAPLSDCASVKASDSTVCNGGSTTLSTQLSTVNNIPTYSWEQNTGTGWVAVPG